MMSQSTASRRPIALVVGLLACLLIVGTIVAVRTLSGGPNSAKADGPAKAADAIAAGLESAAVYQRDRKFAEAAAILSTLVEKYTDDQPLRLSYAQALMGLQKYKEAYDQYAAAIALGNSSITRGGSNGEPVLGDGSLHFQAGTCASMAGLVDRAEEHYSMAQAADPRQPRYPLYLAMVQIKKGDDTAALASLLRATMLNPDLGEAWGTIAEIELRQNRLGLAEQHLQDAIRLQPEVSRWRIDHARILNRRGEAQQAATILLALDPADRRDKGSLTLLAESYGLLKRPADAAKMYADAAAAPSPNDPDAELWYQAALWYDRAGDAERSLNAAKSAAMLGHEGAKEMVGEKAK